MQTTEETMSHDNTITSIPQQVIDYLCTKVVDAALTLLRWLYTPEGMPGPAAAARTACSIRRRGARPNPDRITSITR
jgi:hypothetical protein